MRKHAITRLLLIGLIAFSLVLAGCKEEEEDTAATDGAPTLPDVGSMTVDFSDFGGSDTNSSRQLAALMQQYEAGENIGLPPNYAYPVWGSYYNDAALTVLVWDVIIAVNFSTPVAAFKLAFTQIPVNQGNLTWLWSYSLIGLKTWDVGLTGQIVGSEVHWDLALTSSTADVNGCCTDFTWFDGAHSLGQGGYWQFYDHTDPTAGAKIVRIDWVVTAADQKTLTFTVNSSVPATTYWGNGSYLTYELNGTSLSMTIKNSARTNPMIITLDTITKQGSIRYDDGTTLGCWDGNRDDMTCP